MKLNKKLGLLLLGIWVALSGLISLFSISVAILNTLMALLAIVAGVLVLLDR